MLLFCGAAVLLQRAAYCAGGSTSTEQAAVAQQDAAPQPAAMLY
jgi:hypothetical protein